jgi:hypothetical protein
VTFFFATILAKVEALNLPPDVHQAVIEQLIPAVYLERVAARSTRAESRHRLRTLSAQLLAPLRQDEYPLPQLAPPARARIEQVASVKENSPVCTHKPDSIRITVPPSVTAISDQRRCRLRVALASIRMDPDMLSNLAVSRFLYCQPITYIEIAARPFAAKALEKSAASRQSPRSPRIADGDVLRVHDPHTRIDACQRTAAVG